MLSYSRRGRHLYALGASPTASRLVGISHTSTWLTAFAIGGVLVGLAAIMELSSSMQMQAQLGKGWELIAKDPRESNTEGGVFPALFGTILMVFLMSLVATPLGVLAAIFLREYAHQGKMISIIRIAVNNLAGVPSIVFGVFGVGFFIYFIGGSIDQVFFSESLPTPTFGTGGILWASLTLALMTVPVVIVSGSPP